MTNHPNRKKWQAVAFADCSGHIKRLVLVKHGNEWGVRTIWESGHVETVGGLINPTAYDRIATHPARIGTGSLQSCAAQN